MNSSSSDTNHHLPAQNACRLAWHPLAAAAACAAGSSLASAAERSCVGGCVRKKTVDSTFPRAAVRTPLDRHIV